METVNVRGGESRAPQESVCGSGKCVEVWRDWRLRVLKTMTIMVRMIDSVSSDYLNDEPVGTKTGGSVV